MAAPHVAGAAALVLAASPGLTPAQVASSITSNATPNRITNPGAGSPNLLLFVGAGTPPPTTVTISRYYNNYDHITSSTNPGGSYRLEGPFGRVHTSAQAGTRAFYQCRIGADYFTSLASNCEGQVVIGLIGFAYSSPPSAASRGLYRCVVRSNGEHFDSLAANCEGQITEGLLGYVLA